MDLRALDEGVAEFGTASKAPVNIRKLE